MPDNITNSVGNRLAKVLGIKKPYRDPLRANADPVTRGESTFSVGTTDTVSYIEPEPTLGEWFQEHAPSVREVVMYFLDILPFWRWITRYNWQWFWGDMIAGRSFGGHFGKILYVDSSAGITVGGVVVPQSMSYAKLAELPVQFGLYSSFMGVLIYWVFATSKDITIGVSSLPY